MFRQYVLSNGDCRRVGWLNREPALKRGTRVVLKGDARLWMVEHAGTVTLSTPPERTWQVGGVIGRLVLIPEVTEKDDAR